jgi:type I restriction enzyme, S subunit
MIPKGWKTYRIGDFININPRINLQRDREYSFIEMKDLNASQKYVIPSCKKTLTGGSKFCNGDTLFARITPCLENGKICQASNLDDNSGFGSTEFMVLRGKEGISDSDFIYYLSRTEYIRNAAIKNMTGTSGRQRVENSAFAEIEFIAPAKIPEQSNIASILSSLDDKIELNLQMNRTLESIAQAIFKEWFVDFRFPGFDGVLVDGLPKRWRKLPVTDVIDTISVTYKFVNEKVVFLNTSDILNGEVLTHIPVSSNNLPGQAKKSIQKDDILFSEIRPANRRFAFIDFDASNYVVSTKLMVLRSKGIIDPLVIYYFLKRDEVLNELQSLAESRSGTFPQITYTELSKLSIVIPDDRTKENYTSLLQSVFYSIRSHQTENKILVQLRDMLLPKLMTGKIKVA